MIMPITRSRGYSELIRDKLISGECDTCLEWLEKIIEANDDLLQILDALIPTSHIEDRNDQSDKGSEGKIDHSE